MSILIKGAGMPKSCFYCTFRTYAGIHFEDELCTLNGASRAYIRGNDSRPEYCPLIPIPPHGRLIDADAAMRNGWTINRTYSATPTETVYEVMAIDSLPTIIPADPSKEETE